MRPEEEGQGPVIRDRRRIDPATGQVRDTADPGPRRGPGPAGGQHKPGKHSVSKPGGTATSAGSAGSARPAGDAGEPETGATTSGGPAAGRPAAGGPGPSEAGAGAGGQAGTSPADPATARAVTLLAERTADLQRLQAEYANYRKRVERDRMAVREQALANVLNELLPVLDDIGRAREHGELTGGFKSVADSLEGIAVKLGLTAYGEAGDPFDPTVHEALMHSYSADVTEPTAVQILQPGYKVGERIIRVARVAVAEPAEDEGTAEDGGGPAGPDAESGDAPDEQ